MKLMANGLTAEQGLAASVISGELTRMTFEKGADLVFEVECSWCIPKVIDYVIARVNGTKGWSAVRTEKGFKATRDRPSRRALFPAP